MKVYIVSEGKWDEYYEHGTFSTREKAEAYIAMVNEAEPLVDEHSFARDVLEIREVEVDAAAAYFPVFSITGVLGSEHDEKSELRVSYRSDVPESRFFVTLDLLGSLEEIYAAEGHGRTPEEAEANLEKALAEAAEAMSAVKA